MLQPYSTGIIHFLQEKKMKKILTNQDFAKEWSLDVEQD